MTSLDIGQAQSLIERAKKIKLPPGPTEQDFEGAFSAPEMDASNPADNTARVRTILGDDDFQQGRTIDAMRALGVTYEDLPSEQQQTWDRYSKAWVRAAADMVRAESISKQPGFSSSGGRAVERFVDPLVQIPLDTAYLGAAASSALSEVTGWTEGGNSHMALPRTMNAMLGLEQTQTPIARHYLGALEMAARTGTPVADVYRSTLMADEIVRGSREPGMNIPEDAAGIVGYIYGLTKKGILGGVVGNIAPKAEKLLGLEKLHVKALEWAAKGGAARRIAGQYGAEAITPGARFAVAAAGDAGTGTGDRQELGQAAKAGIVSLFTFPVFTAIGRGAAKVAAKVTGEGLVLRNAFTKWIDAMPAAQSRAFADGGAKAVDDMFARFIREGMPGASVTLKQRVAGAGIQSVLEGIGFSAMSLPFYHDIGKAIASGKWADVEPVLEEIAASSLAMFMMRSGGLFYQAPGTVGPAILRKIQKDPWLRPEYAKEAEPTPDVYTQRKSGVEFVDPSKVEAERPAEVAKPVEKPVDPTEPIAEGKVEAKPAEATKEVAPEAPAKPKPVDKDPPQSARSLLESKLALHGKGELVDIERGVYVIKEPDGSGRQVRFRDGQYQSRPLLSEGEWKKDKALQKTLGRKQPIDLTPKIPEQFTLVDPLMARVATDPSLGLTPAQQDTVRAAASVASRVPAEADRGVLAGLQMIREKPVAEWSADQVGHWVQTVLNGKAPDVLRTSGMAWVNNAPTVKIAEASVTGPGTGPGTAPAPDGVQSVATTPATEPAKPKAKGPALPIVKIRELARAEGIETKGVKRVDLVAALEAKGIETREPVAEAKETVPQFDREPEGVLRLIAQSAGIDVSKVEAKDLAKTLREAGVAEGNEAGAFNLRIAGATTAASIATWSLLNSGVPVEAVMGLALAGIAYPVYKGFGKQLYKTLQDFGPSGLAQRVTDLALESLRAAPPIAARLNRLVQPYLYLTSEQPLAVQRMGMEAALPNLVAAATAATLGWGMGSHPLMIVGGYFAGGAAGALGAAAITKARNPRAQIKTRLRSLATKRTQEEEWVKDANGDEYFVTRFRLFADGWRALDDTVTKGERRIYDRYRDIEREEQFIADEVGMQMLGKDGKRRSTILPEDLRRVLMRLSDDGRAIFEHPDSPEAMTYARINATLNNVPFEVAHRELKGILAAERSIGIEQARKVRYWASGFKLNGKVHRVLDDRPFEAGLSFLTHHVPRLATFSVLGPEKTEGYTSLSPEQLQARKDIEAYTASSPQAHERWIEVSRALHNLRIDKHYLRPGSIPHTLYTRVLSPMRSLWLSQALSGAVTAAKNVLEPLLGTVPIYTSHPIAAQAMLRGWYMRLLAPAEWKAEVTALRNEGYLLPGTPRRFGDLIPGSGGGGKLSASDPNWYRLVEKQMDFVAAGNAGANKMGDVVVALAGKIKVDAWKGQVERTSAQRANDLETLRMMDFKPETAQRMVDGHGTQKDYVDYVSSLRSYTMGQRPRAERGRWEQLALVEQLVPFRSWVSGNIRVWGDHFAQMKRGLNLDQSLPREEARAARRQFFKLVASKGAAGMMGLVATYYLAYGSSIVEAFKDENDDMDAGKFMGEWAKYVAFQEVSGPIISTMMQAGKTGNADPEDLLLGIANQIPYFDMARDLVQAVTMTGPYLNQATPTAGLNPLTALRSFADRVAIFIEGQMGVMRNIRAITDDPQMKLAIRKYYEVLPIEGGAPDVGFTEFRSRMRRMRTKLRSSIAHPETWNPEQRDRLLKEAMGFGPQGWDSVISSFQGQKLVPKDPAKRKALQEGMSKTLFERLVELDSRLDWLIGYAQRRKG